MSKESSKTRQKLYTYDNKCVRIYLKDGTVVEGSCTHNNCDYNEHEYNRREESLVVHSYIFYKREIESVEEISKEECLSSFGWIEEEILKDEMEWIEYEFDTEYVTLVSYATKLNEDNLKSETWIKENVFSDSIDNWVFDGISYPKLKVFEH